MWQFVATIEYLSLAVSVSSLLIRFVLHPLVKDAILMSRSALLSLLAHDNIAITSPPARTPQCDRCAARRAAGDACLLSRHDVAAVVASLRLVVAGDNNEEVVCETMTAVEEVIGEGKLAGEGELREAFYVFDRDEDGYVSAAELWNVLRRLGMEEGARYGDCVRMIAAYDGDGDGLISFHEFRAMMENTA
uniref:EF-hand domain-containing protein n=1 Tax=Leersia perrieri TaxID=77586 RepID=A0A0D9W0M3_9ORYZ